MSGRPTSGLRLGDPVTTLPGVGPARAERLARLGVHALGDLLTLVPRQLETFGQRVPIERVLTSDPGDSVVVCGEVGRVRLGRFRPRRSVLRVELVDGSGRVDALFFNQAWLRERFSAGQRVEVQARVVDAPGRALLVQRLGSAERPLPAPGTHLPVYPLTDGLGQEFLRGLCRAALERCDEPPEESLDARQRAALDVPALDRAVADLHRPASPERFERARRRVALESMLQLLGRLQARRAARLRATAPALALAPVDALLADLPFAATEGQRAAVAEIAADLGRAVPMRRLLQGDVGSGKTAVGLAACLAVVGAGGQAAFLAPTGVLAEQHEAGWRAWLERAGVRTALLTGSLEGPRRRCVERDLAAGGVDLVFGTHALFGAGVAYRNLALAVIDEQHRFGVAQRQRLLDKGGDVHALLMTATPIPRTLALTVYGDLDVSVLAGKPLGRGRVRTRWIAPARRRALRRFLSGRLDRGERLFWVCARIGSGGPDSAAAERGSAAGAEQRHARFQASTWARHGCELVHGRMEREERIRRLEAFRRGTARVLVATTVVEVGVDVPEATIVVVEGADRLGLAQLHQLRGRVGRGAQDGWCFLLGAARAAERFELLERCDDGFAIAEEDLRRRGMGELLGLRQTGEGGEGATLAPGDVELFLRARELIAADAALARRYGGTESGATLVP